MKHISIKESKLDFMLSNSKYTIPKIIRACGFCVTYRNIKFLKTEQTSGNSEFETIRHLTDSEYQQYINNGKRLSKIEEFSGENVRTGINQQTYNFSKSSLGGHFWKDMKPHFKYSYYTNFPPKYGTATPLEK